MATKTTFHAFSFLASHLVIEEGIVSLLPKECCLFGGGGGREGAIFTTQGMLFAVGGGGRGAIKWLCVQFAQVRLVGYKFA